jgi:hypothetical protein
VLEPRALHRRLRAAPRHLHAAPRCLRAPRRAAPEMAGPRRSSFARVFDAVGEELVADLKLADVMRLAQTSSTFLGSVCCRVRNLSLSDIVKHADAKQATALLRRCTGVETVSMPYAYRYQSKEEDRRICDDEIIFTLMAHCTSLRSLRLTRGLATDSAVAAMARVFTDLEELGLFNQEAVTDVALRAIAAHLPKLRLLRCDRCSGISDGGVIELVQKCTSLRSLDLSENLITDAAGIAIGHNCPNLEVLRLSAGSCMAMPEAGNTSITDRSLVAIAQGCARLTCLDLSGASVSIVGIEALAASGCRLQELNLWNCSEISDACVAALLPNLGAAMTLNLDWTGVTVASVSMIANAVPNLHDLSIYTNSCIITYEACAALKGCRALKELCVDQELDGMPADVFDDLKTSNPSLSITG